MAATVCAALASLAVVARDDDPHASDGRIGGRGGPPVRIALTPTPPPVATPGLDPTATGADGPGPSGPGAADGREVGLVVGHAPGGAPPRARTRPGRADRRRAVDGGQGREAEVGERPPTTGARSGGADARAEVAADQGEPDDEDDAPPQGTGLLAEYYDHGTELRRIPRLGGLAPTLTRLDARVDFATNEAFALPFPPETFAVAWSGWFLAERPGRHTFSVGSDDGSRLELDNVVVIENDGLHGHRELQVEVELTAGFHVVRLTFFENYGDASCQLGVAPPGEPMAIAPTRLLFPASAAPRELPVVTSVTPGAARARARVVVAGRGFSDIPSYNRVRLGEAEAFVLEATPEQLVIEVPEGTDQGPLVVDVGGVVTPGVAFDVEGTFGLHGRYLDLEGDVADFVPVPRGPVDLERLDGPLSLRGGGFRLPFPAETFAVTWTGTFFALRPGRHRFFLTCDDGGRLWIDGALVIEHGGVHPATERAGEVVLGAGRHHVTIDYFEGSGSQAITLELQEEEGPRRVVPRGRLEPPEAVRLRAPPRLDALDPPAVATGDLVRLAGDGLTDPVLGDPVVTISGLRAEVVSATWGAVLVRVPLGVDSGPLVLRVGPLEAAPRHLEVVGYGLDARYYDLTEALDRLPELDALTPTLVRIDPVVDLSEDVAFDLPFDPDTFAVRWRAMFDAPIAGLYRFIVGSDDGSRLTVAGQRLLEDSGLHGYTERVAEVWLQAGPAPLQLEYFENGGRAAVRLFYVPPGGERAIVPRLLLRPDPY